MSKVFFGNIHLLVMTPTGTGAKSFRSAGIEGIRITWKLVIRFCDLKRPSKPFMG
jgi:hypothetical protein